ncbi:MAG: hypothetical protein ACOCP8_00780 [archaeon]
MNKFKEKLRKIASIYDFEITGYEYHRDMNMVYVLETQDEELLKKLRTNTLNYTERNFILNSISEYFENQALINEKFWDATIGTVITGFETTNHNYPKKDLINEDVFKKAYTRDGEFRENKFKKLSFEDKKSLIKDYAEFFDYVYANDFRENRSFDIMTLVYVPQLGVEENPNIIWENTIKDTTSSFKTKLRKIIGLKK